MKAILISLLWTLAVSCYSQGTVTVYNECGCQLYLGITRSGTCPTYPNPNFGEGPVAANSSVTLNWPVGFNNNYLGLFSGSGDTWVVNGSANPTYSVEWVPSGCAPNCSMALVAGGAYSCYIYNVSGGCGGSLPPPPAPVQYTNSGCITLNNNTANPQYFQFQATGGSGTQNFSGCNGGLSVNGTPGSSAYGDGNEWLAVYPGETVQVCCAINDGANNASRTLCAMQAPSGLLPCSIGGLQLQGAGPRCVNLCNDGLEIAGNGSATVCDPMAQSSTPNNTSGNAANPPLSGATPPPSGTNGIIWPAGPTNSQTGLMLDITGRTGFAALNQDLIGVGATLANGIYGLEQADALNALGIEQAIHSNAANVVISNLVVSNLFGSNGLGSVGVTNLPTNYPDAAAIGLLDTIASNTARTNGFDTNLEASASAIASNTAAPLAYTNLNTGAYSTNPASVVAYASNTLAGPVNQSLLGYSQSASTAAEAVTVGGSPGSMLTISFSLPVVGSYTIDCNPMDNADVADFASWMRGAMQWLVGLGFIGLVLRDGAKATQSAFQAPQGQFPKLMILGNSVGWPLAAVYVVALVAAMVAVPFAVVTWFSVGQTGQMWWQQVAVNPFSGEGVGRSVALALWLADQFMPMSYIVSSALYYIGFRFALSGVVTVAAAIVRALMA